MYKPISEVLKEIPDDFDRASYIANLAVDKAMDAAFGGISFDTKIINTDTLGIGAGEHPYQHFEVAKLCHLIRNHTLLRTLIFEGWLTDLALGFEQETKSSLLTLVTFSFFNDVKNKSEDEDVQSFVMRPETIDAYIFMIAYLNALTNGRFNYNAFLEDVKFLTGEILSKFPRSDGVKREFGNANYVISNALTNSIDFSHNFQISKGKVIATNSDTTLQYEDYKGPVTAVDTHLMQKLLDLGCFTCDENIIINNYNIKLDLKKIGDNLPEILERIFSEALALDAVQTKERENAYKEIEIKLGDEGYADFLQRLTTERVERQQSSPSPTISSNGNQIEL